MSCRALLAWALVSLFVVVTGADASLVDARGVPSDASGYTSVDASAVNCAAVFPGVSRGCCEALASNSTSDALASRRPLTRMAYASGTSLPYDAGHYHVCVHTPNAAYFLVGWHVGGAYPRRRARPLPPPPPAAKPTWRPSSARTPPRPPPP